MTALTHPDDDSQSRTTSGRAIDDPVVETTVHHNPRGFRIGRVVIGTGVATVAALVGVTVGLPVLAATAIGAGIGGGTVAALAAHAAPLRPN